MRGVCRCLLGSCRPLLCEYAKDGGAFLSQHPKLPAARRVFLHLLDNAASLLYNERDRSLTGSKEDRIYG